MTTLLRNFSALLYAFVIMMTMMMTVLEMGGKSLDVNCSPSCTSSLLLEHSERIK